MDQEIGQILVFRRLQLCATEFLSAADHWDLEDFCLWKSFQMVEVPFCIQDQSKLSCRSVTKSALNSKVELNIQICWV